jgi:hypothetical protein
MIHLHARPLEHAQGRLVDLLYLAIGQRLVLTTDHPLAGSF